jgi:hypothetical protein
MQRRNRRERYSIRGDQTGAHFIGGTACNFLLAIAPAQDVLCACNRLFDFRLAPSNDREVTPQDRFIVAWNWENRDFRRLE